MSKMKIKTGTQVTRMLGGKIPIEMVVTEVNEDKNTFNCGPWTFDLNTGLEIDEYISGTVSYIKEMQ